ncbi:magnesium transporter MgtE [Variibacter gotjawalensis]|uniref:Magnesium transporter MgtE n=1 Tax=Variibacter gotjawalensis TaxID=1333996 RepID=A0A0S3PWV2_9BRAD|nr:magnesium transporter [Variibacter gotjawalensis]NIK46198.1 magnesium transporter [Variibacter gotjawalensis]RZS48115.1 magnesium transporter [Variibacter gotjawalensis]BAT60372.1 magnesium transporter MgtE [Variibacter gotjawalensis]
MAAEAETKALPIRDAEGALLSAFVERVTTAIESGEKDLVLRAVGDLHESDSGDLIEALDPDLRPRLVELMGSAFDFTALTQVDDAIREEILDELEPETVAAGVAELDSDDAVYLLEDLTRDEQTEILDKLPAPERVALERSLLYPEESAGRRMQTEFISVAPFWTVGQTIDHMRETDDLPERFYEIYVVDPAHKLIGTVSLDRLLRTKRPISISELVDKNHRSVHATDDQEEVARFFERYDLIAAPVVDDDGRLVGVMTVDDVVDVIEDEADEDLKALGGVRSAEELSDSVLYTARSRFPWLFANMLTAFLSAFVISRFEGSLEKMVALAVLMPIVASMGGNAGTQTMTVAVRALATQELGRSNAWRIIRREVSVGALNGLAFALIMGSCAAFVFSNPGLFVVMALAVITVLTAAGLGGILIPLGLEKLGVDPAVSSGPFVTTITDVVGFFSFLGIATLYFHLG